MADIYINLTFQQYKEMERQARAFEETTHGEGTEYYHKAFVLNIGDVRFEFHGPNVKARQNITLCTMLKPPIPGAQQPPAVICGLSVAHSGPHSWGKQ